ncbi:PP_RS20740 family protein [Sphingomonas aerolata]|uniref:PP_RS20740 family protein n=1 Tax=Sphingomonas aerolata TaxID=185951 RepID=UPI002FE29024
MGDTDDDIADDVLPIAVDDLAVPIELTRLAPWHRSRKQIIRRDQWGLLSERLIVHEKGTPALPTQFGGAHEVRYLTLPGSDFLDVEMIGELARAHGCTLTSVGFLAGAQGNPTIARGELRQEGLIEAGVISPQSYTFNRRIEEITKKSGAAYRELSNKGPFHVINLDACGSIAPPNNQGANRIIDVVHALLEYQFAKFRGRWLLFLTSDVRQEQFDEETILKLFTAIKSNAHQYADFKADAELLFANDIEDFEASLMAYVGSGIDNFMKGFALGFSKWLLMLAREAGWDMKMHTSFCYSTTPEHDARATMPCLAFEFRPPAPRLVDPTGIAAPAPDAPQTYGERALTVLSKVAGMQNLDERLAANAVERAQLVEETKNWLGKIGYTNEALQQLQ